MLLKNLLQLTHLISAKCYSKKSHLKSCNSHRNHKTAILKTSPNTASRWSMFFLSTPPIQEVLHDHRQVPIEKAHLAIEVPTRYHYSYCSPLASARVRYPQIKWKGTSQRNLSGVAAGFMHMKSVGLFLS